MLNSTLRKAAIATLTIATVAAAGVSSAQAGKGGHGGKGRMVGNGTSIYVNTVVNSHNRHVTCTYHNKLVLNQHNQWVVAKVRNCY